MSGIQREAQWPSVANILELARHTGVPRATALATLAESIDAAERRKTAVVIGSATARQTTRILLSLPAATIVAAEMFGFGVVRVLVGTELGWVCLVVGFGLMVLSWWWMKRIRLRVPTPPLNAGLIMGLAADLALSSGLTPRSISELRSLGTEWGTTSELASIERLRELTRDTGVPIAGLLNVEADTIRWHHEDEVRHSLELLPGALLAPVGLCLFPAFILTTVIPVIAGMFSQFLG